MPVHDLPVRLDGLVRTRFQLSWGKARNYIETGKILVDGKVITDPGALTSSSASIELKMNAPRKPRDDRQKQTWDEPKIVHLDTQIVVLSKPSGLSSVPFENEKMESLQAWAAHIIKQKNLIVVQRLDRETSGLLVFARTPEAGRSLAQQFRFHTVKRRYFALVHGNCASGTIRTELIENRGDGLRGSRKPGSTVARHLAKEAITHVRALSRWGEMTLIECLLETGRTHQIRIHLSEAGHPLVGERLYVREYAGTPVESPRLMLHAAELGFMHPVREVPVVWREEPPMEFMEMLSSDALFTLRERLSGE